MAKLRYSAHALEDLERVAAYLAPHGPQTVEPALDVIEEAIGLLARHPYLGRSAEHGLRELVISQGKTGYVALYWVDEQEDVVFILVLRHQRELDFVP